MNDIYVLLAIVAMGAVTFAIRALPFLGARWLKDSPMVRCIGVFLPPAIMALLTIHSVRDLGLAASGQLWPAAPATTEYCGSHSSLYALASALRLIVGCFTGSIGGGFDGSNQVLDRLRAFD